MYSIIERQLKQPEFTDFLALTDAVLSQDKSNSLNATLSLALRCTSIGQVFASAYRCSLQALLPELNSNQWAALCVTESQGNHPRQLQTCVDEQGLLNGHKSFVSMAEQARQLIVIAKAGEAEGRPLLKAVLIEQCSDGVSLESMPAMLMIPEVSHGKIQFNQVHGKILAGDGYANYSKAFRYIEDQHILLAFITLIFSKSMRHQLKMGLAEKSLLLIAGIFSLNSQEGPLQHLQLATIFAEFEKLVIEFEQEISPLPSNFVNEWQRDKKLFAIAEKARTLRAGKARDWLARFMA